MQHRLLVPASLLLALTIITPAFALRFPEAQQTGSSVGSSSSSLKRSDMTFRTLRLRMRREWKDRENGKISSQSSSSSSVAEGTFEYKDMPAESIGNGQKALLYFYAPWSRTCLGVDKLLKNLSSERHFVLPLYRLDYDSEISLKKKFGVKYVNSFVHIDEKGNMIKLYESPHESQLKLLLYGN
jgi:hypothetical protein